MFLVSRESVMSEIQLRRMVRLVAAIFAATLMPCIGCNNANPNDSPQTSQSVTSAKRSASQNSVPALAQRPSNQIIFQPEFVWASGTSTHEGTGFLVRSPDGKLAGVTSANFLSAHGPALLYVRWLTIGSGSTYGVPTYTRSWGPVTKDFVSNPGHDRSTDYLIMPVDDAVQTNSVLELDPRPLPEINERVWLPNKMMNEYYGYLLVDGTVEEATDKYIGVLLDQVIEIESQSGSPIFSERTGKVIGTFSRASQREGQTWVMLTPAKSIAEVLARHDDFPELKTVIGQLDPP
jgi:hypothetical protein